MAQLLTIAEVAKWLKVSDDVIRAMIKDSEIAASKVRGQWRIEEQSVLEYLATTSNRQPQAIAQPR